MPYMVYYQYHVDRIAELITLTVLWLVISHARQLTSLGRAECHIVTSPFSSPGGWGLGTRLIQCMNTHDVNTYMYGVMLWCKYDSSIIVSCESKAAERARERTEEKRRVQEEGPYAHENGFLKSTLYCKVHDIDGVHGAWLHFRRARVGVCV